MGEVTAGPYNLPRRSPHLSTASDGMGGEVYEECVCLTCIDGVDGWSWRSVSKTEAIGSAWLVDRACRRVRFGVYGGCVGAYHLWVSLQPRSKLGPPLSCCVTTGCREASHLLYLVVFSLCWKFQRAGRSGDWISYL